MTTESDDVRAVRMAIYDEIVARGVAPSPAAIALARGLEPSTVESAFRALADAHVIVLRPSTLELWAAPPFAADETAFRVTAGARSWSAVCAWDAFGIPAALDRDAAIEARCATSGEPLRCGVSGGRAFGTPLLHLLVPAARFWDDIFFT